MVKSPIENRTRAGLLQRAENLTVIALVASNTGRDDASSVSGASSNELPPNLPASPPAEVITTRGSVDVEASGSRGTRTV